MKKIIALAIFALTSAAPAQENAALSGNGEPCLKVECGSGQVANQCPHPVNFARCHAADNNGCLLTETARIEAGATLPFACAPGKLPRVGGCFPPFIPASISRLEHICIPDPKVPDALAPNPLRGTPPPTGTETEIALRICSAWSGQLSVNAIANTDEGDAKFHEDVPCSWLNRGAHLHFTSVINDLESARWLIANGAKVNAKHDSDITPLHWAAYSNVTETAALLIGNGAEVNAEMGNGITPLHWAAGNDATETTTLLMKNGAEVNAEMGGGITPLHWAAGNNATGAAALLIENGAEVNAKTNEGSRPLDWAIYEHNTEMKSLLKRHGGRCNRRC